MLYEEQCECPWCHRIINFDYADGTEGHTKPNGKQCIVSSVDYETMIALRIARYKYEEKEPDSI